MIRISSSYSKKVPADQEYSSQQFHAGLEVELPDSLAGDRDGLKKHLAAMFESLKEAVEEQLRAAGNGKTPADVEPSPRPIDAATGAEGNGQGAPRLATAAQAKAIRAIGRQLGQDVNALVRRQFGVERPERLSLAQASALIDQLKGRASR